MAPNGWKSQLECWDDVLVHPQSRTLGVSRTKPGGITKTLGFPSTRLNNGLRPTHRAAHLPFRPPLRRPAQGQAQSSHPVLEPHADVRDLCGSSMADDFDDYFDDDGTLDALADHELQALEEAAVKSTQQWSTSQAAQQSRSYEEQPPVQRRNPQIPPQNHQHQQPTPRPEHSAPHRIPNQRGQYQQATRPDTYVSYTKSQREQSQPRNTAGAYPRQTARPKATYNQTYVEEATLPFATVPTIPQHVPPAVSDKPSSDYGDFEFEEESELLDTAAPTNADQYQDLRGASSDETLNHNHASRYHGYHNAYGGPTNADPGYDANGIWLQDGQVYDNGIGAEHMDYEQAPLGDLADIQQLRDRVAQV